MNGTSSKIWNRSQADYSEVAIGFAIASHFVSKRPRDTITDCLDFVLSRTLGFEEREQAAYSVRIRVA